MALTVVGPSTELIQGDRAASYDSMQKLLASGAPLRTASPMFMQLFERRERGAAVWGMANGNARIFADLAQMGMRPTSIDGTLSISDRLTLALRATMASPADAQRVAAEVDKVKGPASTMVEHFESRVEGSLVALDVVITEAQLHALIGMLGGAIGP